MTYLTTEIPAMFEKYFSKFDNIFTETSQMINFRLYGIGLLIEIKRKNIQYITKHIIDSDYQSAHHFMHDAPWGEKTLNNQRLEMMESNRPTKSCDDGYAIIDDTGNPKSGDATHATARQWIGSLGKVDRGQVVVTSHYADSRKDWPIELRPYLPQKWVVTENARLGQGVYVFKSKLELGLELVDDLLIRGITFSHLLIDGWYGNSPDFIKGVEDRKCVYITGLYANRRVFYHLPGEPAKNEHYVKDVVTALEDDAFTQVKYIKANGEECASYVVDMVLKIKNLGKRRVLVVKPTKGEKDMEKIEVFMTSDTNSHIPYLQGVGVSVTR